MQKTIIDRCVRLVYQIGTHDNHVPPELLIEIVTEFIEIVNERFGSHVHILNLSLIHI